MVRLRVHQSVACSVRPSVALPTARVAATWVLWWAWPSAASSVPRQPPPKTEDGNYSSSDYYYDYDRDDYRQNNAYSPYASLEIEELRFVDENNNRALDAGEHAKLVFLIRNTGRDYVYDIAPVITVSGTKQIYLSPTAIVKELGPGKVVRYQSEVVATNKLKSGTVDFSIGFSNGDQLYTMRSFQLRTNKR